MYSVPPCYQYGGSPRFARRSCNIVQIVWRSKPCWEGWRSLIPIFWYNRDSGMPFSHRPRGVPPGIDPAAPRIKQGGQVPPNDPRRLMTLLAAIPAGPAAQERHFTVRRNNRPMIGNRPKALNAILIGSLTIITSRSNIFVAADHRLYDCSS